VGCSSRSRAAPVAAAATGAAVTVAVDKCNEGKRYPVLDPAVPQEERVSRNVVDSHGVAVYAL
jgi:hypothetical protein